MNLISTGATQAVDIALLTMPIMTGILSGEVRLVNAMRSLVIMPMSMIPIYVRALQIVEMEHPVRVIKLGGNR